MDDDIQPQDTVLALTTTVGSEADATRLAQALVRGRLAACVQVEPVRSHYRWEGAVQDEPEWRLTLKTTPGALGAVREFLAGHHPCALPQVLWQALAASAGYAAWVRGQVSAPAGEGLPPPV